MTAPQWQTLLAGEPGELARFLKQAAELGDAQAQAMLGQLLLDGHGTEKISRTRPAGLSPRRATGMRWR